MGHAVVVVILSAGFPNALIAQVLGWGAVGLQAFYRAGDVHILAVERITGEVHAAYGKATKVTGLHHDVNLGVYHPSVDVSQTACIVTVFVGDSLAVLVGEVTVCKEVHARHRMNGRTHLKLILELHDSCLVLQYIGRSKVGCGETGILYETVLANRILVGVPPTYVMEDTPAYVAHMKRTVLTFQKVKGGDAVLGIHSLDCSVGERIGFVTRYNVYAVEGYFGSYYLLTVYSLVRLDDNLPVLVQIDVAAASSDNAGNEVLAYLNSLLRGELVANFQLEGSAVVGGLAEEKLFQLFIVSRYLSDNTQRTHYIRIRELPFFRIFVQDSCNRHPIYFQPLQIIDNSRYTAVLLPINKLIVSP